MVCLLGIARFCLRCIVFVLYFSWQIQAYALSDSCGSYRERKLSFSEDIKLAMKESVSFLTLAKDNILRDDLIDNTRDVMFGSVQSVFMEIHG
jgi:hypothetical protein